MDPQEADGRKLTELLQDGQLAAGAKGEVTAREIAFDAFERAKLPQSRISERIWLGESLALPNAIAPCG